MARDYKDRAQRSKPRKRDNGSGPRWLAAGLLVVLFVGFLVFLRSTEAPEHQPTPVQGIEIPAATAPTEPKPEPKPKPAEKKQPEKPQSSAPRFDFYTILPEKEVVIPEHEIKTRKREAKPRKKSKPRSYSLQAGSFRRLADADKRKAELALLGIEARIETAVVNGKQWNRVKIGPYPSMDRVDNIRSRLRQKHIDVVVLNNKQ